MRRLIGLVGYAGTGKDTVADYLESQHGFARLASGDLVRDVLYAANPWIQVHNVGMYAEAYVTYVRLQQLVDADGWETIKRGVPEVRRLLQSLGTEGVRRTLGDDVWIDETLRQARLASADVCITDTRFPNEAAKVRSAGGHIWRIKRPGVGPVNSHSSETAIDHIEVDATIENDGDLTDLHRVVDSLVEHLPPAAGRDWQWAERMGIKTYDAWEDRGPRGFTGGPLHIDVI